MLRIRSSALRSGWAAVVCASLLVASADRAVGRVVYVDNTKSCPGGPGTSYSNAWCSIRDAMAHAGGPGDTVLVKATGTDYVGRPILTPQTIPTESPIADITAADSGSIAAPFVLRPMGMRSSTAGPE